MTTCSLDCARGVIFFTTPTHFPGLGVSLDLGQTLILHSELDVNQDGAVTLDDFSFAIERKENQMQQFNLQTNKDESSSPRMRHFTFEVDEGFFSKMAARESEQTKQVTIHSFLTLQNWKAGKSIFQEIIQRTNQEIGCLYFGWERKGNQLSLRHTYQNGDAVLAHYANVGQHINAFLASSARLDRTEIHGPKSELERVKPAVKGLQPVFIESEERAPVGGGMFSTSERLHRRTVEQVPPSTKESSAKYIDFDEGFFSKNSGPSKTPFLNRIFGWGANSPETLCSLQPSYTISDWPAAKPMIQELISASTKDPGCVYFGWTRVGDRLQCREAYTDGDAVKAHFNRVRPILDKMVSGPATMSKLEVHGPTAELEKIKRITAELNSIAAKKN